MAGPTGADAAARLAGVERLTDLSIRVAAPDPVSVFPQIIAAIRLAGFSMAAPMKLGGAGAPGT